VEQGDKIKIFSAYNSLEGSKPPWEIKSGKFYEAKQKYFGRYTSNLLRLCPKS
jgi:hypothetical protein